VTREAPSAAPIIEIAGEAVELRPERAAHWTGGRALLLADLHLGKSGAFRAAGAAVPDGDVHEQLDRLEAALTATAAERVIVVGDLLHAPAGLTPSLIDAVASWRARHTHEWSVIPGNHDRRIGTLAESWNLSIRDETLRVGPFAFCHDPHDPLVGTACDGYVWSGHTHPAVRLRLAAQRVRVPAFVVGRDRAILPAFSRFTGGVAHRPQPGDRLFAVTPGRREAPGSVIEPPPDLIG